MATSKTVYVAHGKFLPTLSIREELIDLEKQAIPNTGIAKCEWAEVDPAVRAAQGLS